MFDELTRKLEQALKSLRGQGKISEANVEESLREVRRVLLDADVHYKVARDFVDSVLRRAVGVEGLQSITPGQQVVVLGLYRAFASSFATVIESGRARGMFRSDTDPSRDAALIMATLAGILVQQFLSAESEHDSAALIAYLKTTLFQRLLPSGAGSTPAGRP